LQKEKQSIHKLVNPPTYQPVMDQIKLQNFWLTKKWTRLNWSIFSSIHDESGW